MTYEEVKNHFGSVIKAKKALGVKSRQTFYNWRRKGIPFEAQYRIQMKTKGRLRADLTAL